MDLIIIGFDGGDPALLEKWAEQGYLPHLKQIMDQGVYGPLRTTALPITPSAWTSFMTGKNPGKHGVLDFTRVTDDHRLDVVNFHDMHEPTVFEQLDQHKVITLNVPATHPPKPLANGFMVSGMMTPRLDQACLRDDVIAELKDIDYQIEVNNTFQGDNEAQLIPEMERVMDRRTEAAKHLLRQHDPDVFMTVYATGDRACHWFWKHMDKNHPHHQPGDDKYHDVIRRFYMKTDEEIGELVNEAGDNVNVIIMSDHGFTSLEKSINLNNWLMQEGYLKIKNTPLSQARYALFKAGFTMENIYSIVKKLNLAHLVKSVADSSDRSWIREILSSPFLSFKDIDWEHTKAYSAVHFGPIFLNTDDPEERERLKHEIASKLDKLEHQGEKVVEEIEFGDDLFTGEHTGRAPDIIYRTKDMKYQTSRYFEFGSNKLFSKTHNTESGHHRMDGIFLASGPDIHQGDVKGVEILDIAPTILHMLGYGLDPGVDGRVLHEILKNSSREQLASDDKLTV